MYESMREPQSTFSPPIHIKTDEFGTAQKPKHSNPYSGTPMKVSGKLANRIKDSFGIKASELALRESPEVARMGARATAQGNAIRFAPGEFRPDTAEGMEVLGHELNHVREQATGGVHAPSGSVYQNAGHESRSDRAGAAFASGSLSTAPVSVGGINASAAPVQMWPWGKKKLGPQKPNKEQMKQIGQLSRMERHGKAMQNLQTPGGANKIGAFNPLSAEENEGIFKSGARGSGASKLHVQNKDVFDPIIQQTKELANALGDNGFDFSLGNQGLTNEARGVGTHDYNASTGAFAAKSFDLFLPYLEQEGMQDYIRALFANSGGADFAYQHNVQRQSFEDYVMPTFLSRGLNQMMSVAGQLSQAGASPDMLDFIKNVAKNMGKAQSIEYDSKTEQGLAGIPPELLPMLESYRTIKNRVMQIGMPSTRDSIQHMLTADEKQLARPAPVTESAPALAPVLDAIAPDMGKESAGRGAMEAAVDMDAISEAAPEAAPSQSRAHSNTIFTTPTSHDSGADPEYVNLAQRSPERRKIEHIQAIMEGLKGKQPGQMGTHLPTLVALMEQFNNEHMPTSAQSKEKKPWYKRLFGR